MNKQFISSLIMLFISMIVFFFVTYAWFAESKKNSSRFEGEVVEEASDQFGISQIDINGEYSNDPIEFGLGPNEFKIIGYEINYTASGKIDIGFSDIVLNKDFSDEEKTKLYDENNYKGIKLLNLDNHFYSDIVLNEDIFSKFVNEADVRNTLKYSMILSDSLLSYETIKLESNKTEIENESIIRKVSFNDYLSNINNNSSVVSQLELSPGRYYLFISFFFDPNIYVSTNIDETNYLLENSNPFLFQKVSFNIKFTSLEKGE